jgi:hypothetical protein
MRENDGQGGSYVIQDGQRVLLERTRDHPDGNRPRDENGKPLDEPVAPVPPKRKKGAE